MNSSLRTIPADGSQAGVTARRNWRHAGLLEALDVPLQRRTFLVPSPTTPDGGRDQDDDPCHELGLLPGDRASSSARSPAALQSRREPARDALINAGRILPNSRADVKNKKRTMPCGVGTGSGVPGRRSEWRHTGRNPVPPTALRPGSAARQSGALAPQSQAL